MTKYQQREEGVGRTALISVKRNTGGGCGGRVGGCWCKWRAWFWLNVKRRCGDDCQSVCTFLIPAVSQHSACSRTSREGKDPRMRKPDNRTVTQFTVLTSLVEFKPRRVEQRTAARNVTIGRLKQSHQVHKYWSCSGAFWCVTCSSSADGVWPKCHWIVDFFFKL